jgi:hypothetical protein
MYPSVAGGAAAGEACVVPPGTYQWIVDGPAVVLQAKINCLQMLSATGVRTARLLVDDVGRHEPLLPSEAV